MSYDEKFLLAAVKEGIPLRTAKDAHNKVLKMSEEETKELLQ
jgi:hypothetical protein